MTNKETTAPAQTLIIGQLVRLANHAEQIGHHALLEPFRLMRVNPGSCYLQTSERRVGGLPMFDGAFTNATA